MTRTLFATLAIGTSLLMCQALSAETAQQTINRLRETIKAKDKTIAKQGATIAAQSETIEALTPPLIKPVVMERVVLSDGPEYCAVVNASFNLNGRVDGDALRAQLKALAPTVKWCKIDFESGVLSGDGGGPESTALHAPEIDMVLAIAHQTRPGIKFGLYGMPVTTCGGMDAEWHAVPWAKILEHADFLCPSIYQGQAAADRACVKQAVEYALTFANGKPVVPSVTHRSPVVGGPLVDQGEFEKHAAAAFEAVVILNGVADQADGLLEWNADRAGFQNLIKPEVPAGVDFDVWCDAVSARYVTMLRNVVLGTNETVPTLPAPVVVPPTPPTGATLPFAVAPPNLIGNNLALSGGRFFLDGRKDCRSTAVATTGIIGPVPGFGNAPIPYHAILVNDNADAQRIEINDLTATNLFGYAAYIGGGSDIRINNLHGTAALGTWENGLRLLRVQRLLIDGGWLNYRNGTKDALRVYQGATVCVRDFTFMGGALHIGWPEGIGNGEATLSAKAWLLDVTLDEPKQTKATNWPFLIKVYKGATLTVHGVKVIMNGVARELKPSDIEVEAGGVVVWN